MMKQEWTRKETAHKLEVYAKWRDDRYAWIINADKDKRGGRNCPYEWNVLTRLVKCAAAWLKTEGGAE